MMEAHSFFLMFSPILLAVLNIEICAGPVNVILGNDNRFKDDWDYKIRPHNIPLLNGAAKIHILPSISKDIEEKPSKATKNYERTAKKLGDAVRSRVSCSICKIGVGLLQKEVNEKHTFDDIKAKFVSLCVALKVESENVCTGIFDVFGPDVLAALEEIQIGPVEICSLVLGEVCGDVENPLHEWEISLPNTPKPDLNEPALPKEGLPTFKVLQLSDTHYDPDYIAGSVSNCEEPLCCHSYSTPLKAEKIIPAGKWGSYKKCDSPKILIENMLKNIVGEHPDIDYIIWTGDLPPHDIWNQTKSSNLDIIHETVEQMFDIFPNVPIFPALGNHESIPAGSFAPPWVDKENHTISWLYQSVADHWRRWLPASAGNTVLHGGFYSVLIRPGFRLIALNTNYCHAMSWWLIVNSTDPARELEWLVFELQAAEDKGEKVHLIGHVPPGSADCMKIWSRNFYKIVERYENTIMAQFYGHTHADEFEVFYDYEDNRRPTNVAYLGPSVTTYDDFNPAYRIYFIDGDHDQTTREVIDHETWTMNLHEANEEGEDPKWFKLYSAKSAYNMPSLRPKEWAKVIDNLVDNPDLFDTFYKFYYRDSPTRPSCDSKCKLEVMCDLKSGRSHYRHHLCHDLELIFG